MVTAPKAARRVGMLVVLAAILAALALWASPAQAAGTPGAVPGLVSTTHPNPSLWYPSANPAFTWNAATESGGTIAGYSFVLDQNAATVPTVSGGTGPLSFSPATTYTVGSGPAEDRVADLAGNGIQDVIVENASSNTVSVLMGNGDGTFKPAVNYAVGANPWSMDIGDLTGNGKLDIVTCNEAANTVSVLMGNGDGTFQPAVSYSTGSGSAPECLRLADLTGDGKLDIITANAGTNTIGILLNNGNGTFGAPTTFATATHPTSIAVGDFNGDGKMDIATANYTTNNVSVLMGNGDGTFQPAVNYSCGSEPETIAVADLNGDGHPDIVTANYSNSISVVLNNGNGTFQAAVNYTTGSGPYSLDVADLNADGIPDIVTVNHAGNNVSVLLGNGDGTFQSAVNYAVGNGPFWVALGNFNGNGYGDIAVTNETDGTVSVLLGSECFRAASGKLAASFTGKADGTWYFHVRAVDSSGVGGPTATCEVNIDTKPPVTTASGLQGSATSGWTNITQSVTLTATGATSGVANTYYTLDGVQHTYGGSAFQVSAAGSHTITYWSTDNAGNTETTHTGYVNIDTTPPVTSASGLAGSPTGSWHTSASSFTLSANDAGGSGLAATYYTIDGGATQTYSGSAVPVSGDASHLITYWSTDKAGNVEGAHTGYMNIDGTKPTTTASGLQGSATSGWTNSTQSVTLTATDATSGVANTYYTLDGVQHTYGGSAFQVSAAGSHTITFWSTDNAGNTETTHTGYVNIDTTPPVTSASGLAGSRNTGWSATAVPVSFTDSDSQSGVAVTCYTVDGGSAQLYGGVTLPIGGTSGSHIVTYWSVDNAGNVEGAHIGYVNIDTTPPVTTASGLQGSATSGWSKTSPVTVTLSASDSESGMSGGSAGTYYRLGASGAFSPYTGSFTVSGDGSHEVDYYSVDALGNTEATNVGWVNIDTTPPSVSDDAPNTWSTTPVTVTLSASDAGSGVAYTQYKADGDTTWHDTTNNQFTVLTPSDGSNDGVHTYDYRAVDNAGNETDGSCTVRIDTTPPSVSDDAPNTWSTTPVTVTLSASDAGSGVAYTQYKADGDTTWHDTTNNQFTVLTPSDGSNDGVHTYDYRAVDNAGNETDGSCTVRIDTTPPVTTASGLQGSATSGWSKTSPVTVTLSASDSESGMSGGSAGTYYRLGASGAFSPYTGSFTVSGDGSHEVDYYSVDALGNTEATNVGWVNIDTTPPSVSDDAPNTWSTTPVTVTLSASDAGSGVAYTQYKADGDTTWHDTTNNQFTVLTPSDGSNDGVHTYDYRAVDNAGNETDGSCTVRIDTTPPSVSDDAPNTWSTTPVTVTLSASDAGSGVAYTQYKADGDTTWHDTTNNQFTVLTPSDGSNDGVHTYDYRAVDNAGNETDGSCTVRIDTTPPSVSDDAPNTWSTTPVTVTLSASDAGSGVAYTQYKADGDTTWHDTTNNQFTVLTPSDGSNDGVHTYDYRAVDNAGNETDGSCTVRIDTTPPVTTASGLQGSATSGWSKTSPVTVTLSASDSESGMSGGSAGTYYRLGASGAFSPYTGSFTVSGDGSHEVDYYSVDALGNTEATNVGWVNIDTTPPSVSDDAPNTWSTTPVTVTLSASDAGSGVAYTQYKADGDTTWHDTTNNQFTVLTPSDGSNDGVHTYDYRAVDNAGNETDGSCTVRIDTTPPSVSDDAPNTWSTTPVTVTLSASDAGSGVAYTQYKADGDTTWHDTTNNQFTVLTPSDGSNDGVHTYDYRAVDNAGNETDGSCTVRIDTTPPVTTASGLQGSATSGWSKTSPVTVTLSASDSESGMSGGSAGTYYRLGASGAFSPYTGSFTVSGDGSHEVDYYSVDALGNTEATNVGYVNIDSVPPQSTALGLQSGQDVGWQKSSQSVTIEATDTRSGMVGGQAAIYYTVDGNGPLTYTGPFVVSGDGSHPVTYWAEDAAGNLEAPAHLGYVNIDTTPPVTTASGLVAGSDGNFIDMSQEVTLSATDAGCGVAATYYTLDGGSQMTYSGPFTVAGVASHTVTYWSVDNLGNREATETGYVNIAPTESLITLASGLAASPTSDWQSAPVTVTLSTSGGGGTITTYYRLSASGAFSPYTAPFTVSGSGSHRIDYYSGDSLGATEQTNTGYVNIDTTPPVTTASGPLTPQRTTVVVHLSATDPQSGVSSTFYRVDNQPLQIGTVVIIPAPANHSNDGVHTITYYSVDVAGNVETAHHFAVTIDTTRPVLTVKAKRIAARHGKPIRLQISARDASSCQLLVTVSRKVGRHVTKRSCVLSTRHAGSWQAVKLRLKLSGGVYALKLQLRDAAGNVSAVKNIFLIIS